MVAPKGAFGGQRTRIGKKPKATVKDKKHAEAFNENSVLYGF
jgi:hypothetical protein